MNTVLNIKSPTQRTKTNSPVKTNSRNWFKKAIDKFKAKRRAKKIANSLHEAEAIHAGRKKGKSFDEFLSEF